MKTSRFLTLMILAVGLFLGSCSNDDNTTVPNDNDNVDNNNDGNNNDNNNDTNSTPVITNGEDEKVDVLENDDGTTSFFTVEATDADTDDSLSYTITAGNDEGLFTVDENGNVSVAADKSLDFEITEQYSITITVSDGEAEDSITLTINVQNVIEDLFEDPASFIFTIDTELVPNLAFSMEAFGDNVNLTVDWGDGSDEEQFDAANEISKFYQPAGQYTVAIKGTVDRLSFDISNGSSSEMLLTVQQWGTNKWKSMASMFRDASNFTGFGDQEIVAPDLSECTSFANMFRNAGMFNGSMSQWDVSKVTDTSYMFFNAEVFDKDISDWFVDQNELTDMQGMFQGAVAFDQDISNWNTSKVTNMIVVFAGANDFNQDIGGWDTGVVGSMAGLFSGATSFDQDLGGWDIGNVSNMSTMFDNSGMSPLNLSLTLIGWADDENGEQSIPENIDLGVSGLQVCNDTEGYTESALFLAGDRGWEFLGLEGNINCN